MEREALVDNVTKIIMERLNAGSGSASGGASGASVVTFGDVPANLLGAGASVRQGRTPADVDGAQYIVLTQQAFRVLHGGVVPAALGGVANLSASSASAETSGASATTPGCSFCGGTSFDLTGKKVIGDRDIRALGLSTGATVRVDAKAIVTALARDYATSVGATITR